MTWTSAWQKHISREKITSCLVLHNGDLQFSYYKNRKAADKLHKVNSVTKSVTSALIGTTTPAPATCWGRSSSASAA